MFAFFFDEDCPTNASPYGPQMAARIVSSVEQLNPIPKTRLLSGSLLHTSLCYDLTEVSLTPIPAELAPTPHAIAGRQRRMEPNYDRMLAIVCDLAETLSGQYSSFDEETIWEHLAKKNIWVIVLPNISHDQARFIHDKTTTFDSYLGYSYTDTANPVHRRLFLDSLYNDKAVSAQGLAFRFDEFDEDDPLVNATAYGSKKPAFALRAEDFDARFPNVVAPKNFSSRGKIAIARIFGADSGHRARVAEKLSEFDNDGVRHPISFSAKKPDDGVEFILPDAKFEKYLLNVNHSDGGPKARFFIDTLNIKPDDWRYLADQILQGAKKGELYRLTISQYGASHGILVLVTGRNDEVAAIETGWLVPDKGPATFVTAYPADRNIVQKLHPSTSRVPPPSLVDDARWAAIHEIASRAGQTAASSVVPIPMALREYGTIWDGKCGFAWIQLPNGKTGFSRWVVANGHGDKTRPGARIYADIDSQSVDRQLAYAHGYAEVLRVNGIDCTVDSRLD